MHRFLKNCKKEIFVFLLTTCLWAAVSVCQAFLLEYISDTVILGAAERIGGIIVLALAYLAAETSLEFGYSYSVLKTRSKISMNMRNALLRRISCCSPEEKESKGDGHYLSMLNDQVSVVETEYIDSIMNIIFQFFSLIFALLATTAIEPLMTLIVLALCILPLVIPKLLQKKLESTEKESTESKARYVNLLSELMSGFASLKIFGRGQETDAFHQRENANTRRAWLRNKKWQRLSMTLSYGLGNFVILTAWIVGAIFALNGTITMPELIALTSLMTMVAGPFQIVSELFAPIFSGRVVAKHLVEFLDSGEKESNTHKSDDPVVKTIGLSRAFVVREGRVLLNRVSIEVKSGEKIGIIGHSGSGKSTLLRTLAGLLEMQEGELLVNGKNVAANPGMTHRDLLYLPQQTTLFSATIADNVTLFREMPEGRIVKVLEKAGLGDWFRAAGGNAGKRLEKSSVNLSGGELRRFDFARELAQDGKILLFDEPTAGLDAFNARRIMEQISAMEDRVVLVSTHDLDEKNLERFDRIVIMSNGEVIDSGTPDQIFGRAAYQALRQGEDKTAGISG